MKGDGDVAGLRNDEFFDFDVYGAHSEFREDGGGNVGGKFFDEFPAAAFTELQQTLGDREIIHGVGNGIGPGSGGEIGFHFHGEQQALRAGALFVGHTNMAKDFEINYGNFRHG